MTIRISFQDQHLSISTFPSVEVPDFTLITGVNGSGKTHFLRALNARALTIEGVSRTDIEIRYLDWDSVVPRNQGAFTSGNLSGERSETTQFALNCVDTIKSKMKIFFRENGSLKAGTWQLESLDSLNDSDARAILSGETQPGNAVERISELLAAAERHALENLPFEPGQSQIIDQIRKSSDKPIYKLTKKDLESFDLVNWGKVDIFAQSFARVFVAYRDFLLRNNLRRLRFEAGDKNVEFLTDDQILRRLGAPPWDFLNEVFHSSGLDFEVDPPDPYSYGAYEPFLVKRSSRAKVQFSSLSSGEKILMSIATCLYNVTDPRPSASFPDVLLLDEVDALLHPSMARTLLRALTETLVGKFGIKVIATTHSPSTVALGPEDSIFVMRAESPGLQKVSKSEALGLLSVGVPTLSLSFEGRRQVLVESPNDAEVYDQIYQHLKPKLASERSLQFISTGSRTKAGDQQTGCDQVKRFADEFRKSGNGSVYGLIDWDGKNQNKDNIFVLARDRRNGLENCALDPVFVALLLHRHGSKRLPEIGIEEGTPFMNLVSADQPYWQSVVDRVQMKVLDQSPLSGGVLKCTYIGGLELSVTVDYLQCDDHQLKDKITTVFPELKRIREKTGLVGHVAQHLFRDASELIPIEFLEVFEGILNSN